MPEREQRRLVAILAADMAGYSRLMEADERGTIARQRDHRASLIDPTIAAHGGRIVKTMGDGLLVEFPSVVDAVGCAAAIQRAMTQREAALPDDRRIRYRMGVNLGDIVIDGDDILGDGVNVAARLEALAEPGGICVPRKVVDEVGNRLDLGYAFIGEQKVKNIAAPIPAYRVLLTDTAAGAISDARRSRHKGWRVIAAVLVGLVVLAAGVGFWAIDRLSFFKTVSTAAAGKPSIAVLPFANLSDDPAQEWFVDGVTDDLITDLSKVAGLEVIARNSVFVYKGQRPSAHDVSRDLAVSHVLDGSVRRFGDRVRINAELVDASTGEQLWAERFDETMSDIFAVQDRVTRRVLAALAVALTASEAKRVGQVETLDPAAYEAFLRGREHLRRYTPEDLALARDELERAVALDPGYAHAHAALALVYHRAFELGWARALGLSWGTARLRAGRHMVQAWQRPTPLAHRVAAEMFLRVGRSDDALEHARAALALVPNDPENLAAVARSLIFFGQAPEAIALMDQAMRLDVHYPAEYLYWRGLALFGLEAYDEALADFEGVVARTPTNHRARALLAATYAHLGRDDAALAAFTAYRAAEPDAGSLKGAWTEETLWLRWPYRNQDDFYRLAEGLEKAGGQPMGRANLRDFWVDFAPPPVE